MKKNILLLIASFGLIFQSYAQCDSSIISNAGWVFTSVNSTVPAGTGSEAVDGDSLTVWHTEWDAAQPPFPHEIQFDLGVNYPVSGVGIMPRQDGALNGKVTDYEVYLSLNGTSWTLQSSGSFSYSDNNDIGIKQAFFSSINARYVKFVGLSGLDQQHFLAIAEIEVYQDLLCAPTGQDNQTISFNSIPKKYTSDAPFVVSSIASTGLPVTYSIVSGPAAVLDSTITLTGASGVVVVKAEQVGNVSYYPVTTTQSFEVVDLTIINPEVSTKLTNDFPIEMPNLNAYPLYANASIDEPAELSISSVEFEIDGDIIDGYVQDGYYLGWWTPSAIGNYDVYVKATASNGNVTRDTVNVDVTTTVADRNVQTFDGDLVAFGNGGNRTFYGVYTLPQSIGAYDQIMANFSVTCPSIPGACDDWDRLAYAEYKAPDGTWMELFRYITPYGVACNHSIDVTDYASLLHGNIEIRMFIDTWGTGGWDVHLDFDYVKGTPDYLYSSIKEVWHGNYNFGNPTNLQPCDTVEINYPNNTQKATFRVTSTGHGWGSNNSDNAAEFYEATHNFHINGISSYSQYLWNDCDPNPDNCTGQLGTWTYNRAGWCPGTIAPPNTYDLTSQIGNAPFNFSYVFQQSYQDNCHPNNPNCVTGVTCNDCNAGYNPFYRVGAYMISFSNSPISSGIIGVDEEDDFGIDLYPNPNKGIFKMTISRDLGDVVVSVNDVTGAVVKTYFFNKKTELDSYQFDISSLSKGTYFVNVKNKYQSTVKKVILN